MTRRRVIWISLFPRSDANYADTLCFGNHQIEKIKIMLRVAVQRHGEALHTRAGSFHVSIAFSITPLTV